MTLNKKRSVKHIAKSEKPYLKNGQKYLKSACQEYNRALRYDNNFEDDIFEYYYELLASRNEYYYYGLSCEDNNCSFCNHTTNEELKAQGDGWSFNLEIDNE